MDEVAIQGDDMGVETLSGLYHGGHMPIRILESSWRCLGPASYRSSPPRPKSCLARNNIQALPGCTNTPPPINSRRARRPEMLPTTIHAPPSLSDFTPLSEYQSTTPETFHGGKPVLHYHATGAKAWLPKDQQSTLPIFPADSPVSEGDSGEIISQDDVELFINSE